MNIRLHGNIDGIAEGQTSDIQKAIDKAQKAIDKAQAVSNSLNSAIEQLNIAVSSVADVANNAKTVADKATTTASSALSTANTAKSTANSGLKISASKLAENGYIKLNNGLIMQWGVVRDTNDVGTIQVTFPIAFTKFVNVSVSVFKSTYSEHCIEVYGNTLTDAYISRQNRTDDFNWIAIGV